MKKAHLALLLIMVIAATTACAGTQSGPVTITDDWGRQVHLNSAPTRIISHVPSITETIFSLGLSDKVVADSDYCDYPEAAKNIRDKIGGYFTPNIEQIVAMKPDLVLTDGYVPELITKLDSLGIPIAVINPKDINSVLTDIDLLGNITGSQKEAKELTDNMRKRIDAVVNTVGNVSHPSVFYVFDATDTTKPWTAGPGSFVDALIGMAGGVNVAASASDPWIQFNMEELVNSNPDIILVDSSHGTAAISPAQIKELPGWQDLKAAKENLIYIIGGDLINRSGPRIVEGLEEMAKILHPGLFND